MAGPILALNCGSSSIKFALFEVSATGVRRQPEWAGAVRDLQGSAPTIELVEGPPELLTLRAEGNFQDAVIDIAKRLDTRLGGRTMSAVAHRVVHGGVKYSAPVSITPAVMADLRGYTPLAPLHQPAALDAIDVLLKAWPGLAQVACFDTAFHRTMPMAEQMLPLPRSAWERGIRRYGFHGLSYEYQTIVLKERYGAAAHGRVIVAHLGSGASLCAMQHLQSVTTTMGFSALDGLMMGTRCGSLDPGVLLHFLDADGGSPTLLSDMLYHRAGLLGVSGLSADPRVLLEEEHTNGSARLALDMYVRRIVREVGGLVAVLGGLDMLVFTAGIGEHSAQIRSRVCEAFDYLGLRLDGDANLAHASTISKDLSRIRVLVEPAAEEWVAAQHAWKLVRDLSPEA